MNAATKPEEAKLTISLTPRQALALKTGLEQIKTLLIFTGLDEKEGHKPFYAVAELYQQIINMLPTIATNGE